MTDVPSFRAVPDAEFADRLERELLRRLAEPAVFTLTEVPLVTDVPDAEDDESKPDIEVAERRRRPSPIRLVAGGLIVAGLIAGLVLVDRSSRESQVAGPPPAANGLLAFVGESAENPAESDIYVVAPDGTGLRPLTSTPGFVEYAPAWSPDGSGLAFVRTSDDEFSLANPPCRTDCQLVVVDPSTGVETFSADIKEMTEVPQSVTWSPDGRAIAISSAPCAAGGCGPGTSRIVDLEAGSFTTFTPPSVARWSPDGEWLALFKNSDRGASLLLVPADLIPTGGVLDVAGLAGVRPLPEPEGFDGSVWMPDGSAMLGTHGDWSNSDQRWIDVSIDVMTVADGERRTLIEDGFDPVASPDGTQIAYSRDETPGGVKDIWVAAADGSDAQPVTTSSTPPAWSPDGSLLLASDQQGWFTVRPDGTDRTALGIRDHAPSFRGYDGGPWPGFLASGVDWQPLPPGSSIPT
jgi:dipeptidyl aminopeptidase/acylaminoacyl peptidase